MPTLVLAGTASSVNFPAASVVVQPVGGVPHTQTSAPAIAAPIVVALTHSEIAPSTEIVGPPPEPAPPDAPLAPALPEPPPSPAPPL
jgi:hypothetical protein